MTEPKIAQSAGRRMPPRKPLHIPATTSLRPGARPIEARKK